MGEEWEEARYVERYALRIIVCAHCIPDGIARSDFCIGRALTGTHVAYDPSSFVVDGLFVRDNTTMWRWRRRERSDVGVGE